MRRCPKCNRSFDTDTQKFCTHDGGLLFVVTEPAPVPIPDADMSETVQLDSNQIRDAVSKPTTRDLAAPPSPGLDPEATVVSESKQDDATRQMTSRDTRDFSPLATQQMSAATVISNAPPSPETSAPLPAPPATSTGSIAPPPPQTSQPLPPPQAAPRKKSKLPLVLGILAVVFVISIGVVVAAYFVVVRPMIAAKTVEKRVPSAPVEPTPGPPVAESTPGETRPANEPPPYSPPADAVQFANSKDNLDGKLSEHYIDFTFYYPNRWEKDPKAGVPGASNFAKVERRLPPDFTQENFAVGWYSSSGSPEADRALYHNLAENLSAQLQTGFPEYRKVSEGETHAGVYDGYEFRFEAVSRDTAKGDIQIWGRVIFVPPTDGSQNGATLLMLATSLAPELKSIDDIGVKGELPMLLESFRFGKK